MNLFAWAICSVVKHYFSKCGIQITKKCISLAIFLQEVCCYLYICFALFVLLFCFCFCFFFVMFPYLILDISNSVDDCQTQYSTILHELYDRYANTIVAHFYGHTHRDQVNYDKHIYFMWLQHLRFSCIIHNYGKDFDTLCLEARSKQLPYNPLED